MFPMNVEKEASHKLEYKIKTDNKDKQLRFTTKKDVDTDNKDEQNLLGMFNYVSFPTKDVDTDNKDEQNLLGMFNYVSFPTDEAWRSSITSIIGMMYNQLQKRASPYQNLNSPYSTRMIEILDEEYLDTEPELDCSNIIMHSLGLAREPSYYYLRAIKADKNAIFNLFEHFSLKTEEGQNLLNVALLDMYGNGLIYGTAAHFLIQETIKQQTDLIEPDYGFLSKHIKTKAMLHQFHEELSSYDLPIETLLQYQAIIDKHLPLLQDEPKDEIDLIL